MVDNTLNLFYLEIMMGKDIKEEEKRLHIGKERWDFRKKASSILQGIFVVYPVR